MHCGALIKQATARLADAGIGTARLDALVLAEDVSGRDRAWLLAHPEFELSSAQAATLKKLLNRRARHEPLAYVRGKTEFYGREFVLMPAVLEPRPESETMIDLLKALPMFRPPSAAAERQSRPKGPAWRLADVGTGSGALGITAALELPEIKVDLLEIDPAALKIATINVDKFTPGMKVIKSDLLAQSGRDYDILLCNLPYVPDDFRINRAAAHEPRLAIFGGPDGLDVYRRLFEQLRVRRRQPLYILVEALPPQHAELAAMARAAGYDLQQTEDFIQQFRRTAPDEAGDRI